MARKRKKNPEIKDINRQSWTQRKLRISLIPPILNGIFILFAVGLISAGIIFFGDITFEIFGNEATENQIIAGIIGVIVLISILIIVYNIAFEKSKYVLLRSGDYKIIKSYVVVKPGKIYIQRGILRRQEQVYPVSNFETVFFDKGLLGRIFNYGNIILNKNPEDDRDRVIIKNIVNPHKAVIILQNMIDSARSDKLIVGGDTNKPNKLSKDLIHMEQMNEDEI